MSSYVMKILGIDPGSHRIGYGLIDSSHNEYACISYGVIDVKENDTPSQLDAVYGKIRALMDETKPEMLAIERLFFFKNAKTAFHVSESRGVILLAAAHCTVPFVEYTPLQVKQAVSSYGRTHKTGIQRMVQLLLGLPEIPEPDDAADALALAICAANTLKEGRG